jgi:hypothetical protein
MKFVGPVYGGESSPSSTVFVYVIRFVSQVAATGTEVEKGVILPVPEPVIVIPFIITLLFGRGAS